MNLSVVYQDPNSGFVRGRQPLTGGWQLSGILSAASGSYLTVTTGVDNALSWSAEPTRQPGSGRSVHAEPELRAMAESSRVPGACARHLRDDADRRLPGPGRWNVDINLMRSLRLAGNNCSCDWRRSNVSIRST